MVVVVVVLVVVLVVVDGGGAAVVVVVVGGVVPLGTLVDVFGASLVVGIEVVLVGADDVVTLGVSVVVVVTTGLLVVEDVVSEITVFVVGTPAATGESSTPVRIPVTAADAIVSEIIVAPSQAAANPSFLFIPHSMH